MAIRVLPILVLFPAFLQSLQVLGYSQSEIKWWCAQTPHPNPCEYFLTRDQNSIHANHNPGGNDPIRGKSDFLRVSLRLALDQAQTAHSGAFSLGPRCRSGKEKAAWADCLQLYEYTVNRLNHTASSDTKCTKEDAQTWLSTALTNLETCRAGFVELGVPDNVLPLMSNNVSDLISNALALNDVPYNPPSTSAGGLPTYRR
ncbi:hypothetical protein SAY87_014608 [Trapa incisa]|uniref:Pectinesterase inhibitor domain-containing protein n=1 Tax=Trapa incisa TaxID=236973 RepID=A0AAN7GWF1_9MYRT|nr:hypothetical protein SAY87_014608 [Trapa incisa]